MLKKHQVQCFPADSKLSAMLSLAEGICPAWVYKTNIQCLCLLRWFIENYNGHLNLKECIDSHGPPQELKLLVPGWGTSLNFEEPCPFPWPLQLAQEGIQFVIAALIIWIKEASSLTTKSLNTFSISCQSLIAYQSIKTNPTTLLRHEKLCTETRPFSSPKPSAKH